MELDASSFSRLPPEHQRSMVEWMGRMGIAPGESTALRFGEGVTESRRYTIVRDECPSNVAVVYEWVTHPTPESPPREAVAAWVKMLQRRGFG